MKEIWKYATKGFVRRAIGHGFFATLFIAVLYFVVWLNSFWGEPLGWDGLVLVIALMWVLRRHLPFVDRIVFGNSKTDE